MYQDIQNKIRPLDLICFKGSDAVSKFIRLIERGMGMKGEFSHVGLVITKDVLPLDQLEPGKKYVWESTCSWPYFTDGTPDAISGEGKLGVQIRDLEIVIDRYLQSPNSSIAWCKLKNNPIDKNIDTISKMLLTIYEKYGDAKYESPLGLCAAVCPPIRHLYSYIANDPDRPENVNPEFDGTRMFCSELVALVYQELGLLDISINPSKVLPSHFIDKLDIISNRVYIKQNKRQTIPSNITFERSKSDKILLIKIDYTLS